MNAAKSLEDAYGFDAEELALNRSGDVSERQRIALDRQLALFRRTSFLANAVFVGMAGGATGFALLISGPGTEDARPFLLGFAGLLWLVAGFVWLSGRRSLRQYRDGRIRTLEGPVRLTAKEVTYENTGISLGTAFKVKVGRFVLQVDRREKHAVLEDGHTYRFYVVGTGRAPTILSVERL